MVLTDVQYRAGAIAYVNKYCNQLFTDGSLPSDIEVAIDIIIKSMKENKNVSSQSLGDMSKSFFQDGTFNSANNYLKPYRKTGFK